MTVTLLQIYTAPVLYSPCKSDRTSQIMLRSFIVTRSDVTKPLYLAMVTSGCHVVAMEGREPRDAHIRSDGGGQVLIHRTPLVLLPLNIMGLGTKAGPIQILFVRRLLIGHSPIMHLTSLTCTC